MQLKVISSGSKGNAYLLENSEEILIIECGVNIKKIKEALNFDYSKVVGCIVSHEHGDHAKAINQLMSLGINVFATEGTHAALGSTMNNRACVMQYEKVFELGSFKIKPFDVMHDAAEPCGFLIHHLECGNVLFITDLIYCAYTFPNLNNIIIEANYDDAIAKQKLGDMEFLRNRIIKSHMSIDTCLKTLKANDISQVNNIVLIHLSDGNSDAIAFKHRVELATQKNVTIADSGVVVPFNKTPF